MNRVLALLVVLTAGGCGKTGGSGAIEGVYHLAGAGAGADGGTTLEVNRDGSLVVRRDRCGAVGDLADGDWHVQSAFAAVVHPRGYWPTSPDFPSARVEELAVEGRGGELVAVGRNGWFGTFEQRWTRGRATPACVSR